MLSSIIIYEALIHPYILPPKRLFATPMEVFVFPKNRFWETLFRSNLKSLKFQVKTFLKRSKNAFRWRGKPEIPTLTSLACFLLEVNSPWFPPFKDCVEAFRAWRLIFKCFGYLAKEIFFFIIIIFKFLTSIPLQRRSSISVLQITFHSLTLLHSEFMHLNLFCNK